jgi:hypothetical protein
MRDEQGMAGLSLGCISLVIVVALLMLFVLLAGLASTTPRVPEGGSAPGWSDSSGVG